ncbi:hypothetical protein HUB98_22645 [Paenibacillus barcinonensis]|uniref:LysM domain-containing protein n=1 Tax=Paenibacillus barcinonensis TaxID=198119 RepID=A0ABX6Q9N5_PAEBA|nr:hypothetical protein [Paenibacillus barcinonensis]QKS58742.1 hypothetical protein HUB98_22645 [Paenibacillus barcinonensis]
MAAAVAAIIITVVPAQHVLASPAVPVEQGNAASTESAMQHKKPCIHAGHGLFMIGETAELLGIGLRDLKQEMQLGHTLAQIAKEHKGLTEQQLLQKLKPTLSERLDQAVADGCLTKEQAAAAKADMDVKLKKVVNTPLRELRREFVRHGKHSMVDKGAIARYIGITPEELQNELHAGKSLAEIAKTKGISEAQLVNQLKEQLTGDLQRFVRQKHLEHPVPVRPGHVPGRPATTDVK